MISYTSTWTALRLLLLIPLCSLVSKLYTIHFHLSDIPGPKWAAFTRLWLVRLYASRNAVDEFDEVNKKYGRYDE